MAGYYVDIIVDIISAAATREQLGLLMPGMSPGEIENHIPEQKDIDLVARVAW